MTDNASETSDDSSFTNNIVVLLIDWRHVFLVAALIIGAFAWIGGSKLKIERRLESMFQPNDPILRDYQMLQSKFGGNEVVLLVFQDKGFWKGFETARLQNYTTLSSESTAFNRSWTYPSSTNLSVAVKPTCSRFLEAMPHKGFLANPSWPLRFANSSSGTPIRRGTVRGCRSLVC